MRTLSAQETQVVATGKYSPRLRFRVKDAASAWQDLTERVITWEVDEDVDQPVGALRVSLKREMYHDSISSLRTDARLNNVTGIFVALVKSSAEVQLDVAVMPLGVEAGGSDWHNVFHGYIERVNLGNEAATIEAYDLGRILQRLYIETDAERGNASLESTIQTIIRLAFGPAFVISTAYTAASGATPGSRVTPTTQNGFYYRCTTGGTSGGSEPSWPTTIGNTVASGTCVFTCEGVCPTLYTPTSPSYTVPTYTQQPMSVMEAARSLALGAVGWDVRYKWRSSLSRWDLTLWVVDRAKATTDYTWPAWRLFQQPAFEVNVGNVRNRVSVVYGDAGDLDPAGQPTRKTSTAQDWPSMQAWTNNLPAFMQLAEVGTVVDSPSEAATLAANVLSDLKDPVAIAAYDVVLFPFVEIGDRYCFQADNILYNADQYFAVTGFRHFGTATGAMRTTLRVRGTPVVAVTGWLAWEAADLAPARTNPPSAPTGVTATQTQGGFSVEFDTPERWLETELHVSTSSSFTISASTLKARSASNRLDAVDLIPGTTYYGKLVARDKKGNRSAASSEFSIVAGYTPPRAMSPNATYERIVPNPDFEIYSRGTGFPPDSWFIRNGGAWGTVAEDESSATHSGGHAIHFPVVASGTTPDLYSEAFPVVPGDRYEVTVWAKRPASNGGGSFNLVWLSDLTGSSGFGTTTGSAPGGTIINSTTYTLNMAQGEAPAAAKYARVELTAGTNQECWFDNVAVRRVSTKWLGLSYGTGWGDGAVSWAGAHARNSVGDVFLRGSISRTSGAGTTIATLPVGQRPGATEYFLIPNLSGGVDGYCTINTSGVVASFGAITNNEDYGLSHIRFMAEG